MFLRRKDNLNRKIKNKKENHTKASDLFQI